MAVKPFDMAAKHDLRAEAGPMRSPRSLMFRVEIKEAGRWWVSRGPEMQIEGFFQVPSAWREGGLPMMPPSRHGSGIGGLSGSVFRKGKDVERDRVREGVCVLGSVDTCSMCAMDLAVFEEMALRSMKSTDGASPVATVSFLSIRFLMASLDRHASTILRAVATASRGGTMLRMMSVSTTRASSDGKVTISACLMRSIVDWLGEFSRRIL